MVEFSKVQLKPYCLCTCYTSSEKQVPTYTGGKQKNPTDRKEERCSDREKEQKNNRQEEKVNLVRKGPVTTEFPIFLLLLEE